MNAKNISDLNLGALTNRTFTPSPTAWEDQVLYFVMVDRFSNDEERDYRDIAGNVVSQGSIPPFTSGDVGNSPRDQWVSAGRSWCGGNLQGLISKIGYLKRLGISALWVSPILKQVKFLNTYHGYGIQNFLEVDPHFGSAQDFKDLVATAHANGIYVILDVILNHCGNVFSYHADRYPTSGGMDPRWDRNLYDVAGFNDAQGNPSIPFGPANLTTHPSAWPDGAIWPSEMQEQPVFTRKGRIDNWDYFPEYLDGDFYDLKDINHGIGAVDSFVPSKALQNLCEIYKYWIAFADLDGFRIDTVKHMEPGATRYFASVIKEFTQRIGKENFYLIGEITGGRTLAFDTLEITGLDAALGIDDIPDKLEYLVKGYRNPEWYFDLFRNSLLVGKESHTWFRNKVVNMFDDHDQVRKGLWKARFCGRDDGAKVILNALALNVTTLGIPCIYYGSEQYFNGAADQAVDGNDVFLRECMFGGPFGSFQSQQRHFFDESSDAYAELGKILDIRRRNIALRRGRQYLRQISGDGINFGYPAMIDNQIRSVVPWSRILDQQEVLLAINTDYNQPRTAWVTIDAGLHQTGDKLTCLYSTEKTQVGQTATVEAKNGRAVAVTVPQAGFVILG